MEIKTRFWSWLQRDTTIQLPLFIFISLPSSLFYYIKTIKGRGKHRWKRMLRALPPYSVSRPNFVDVAVEGAVLRAV